MLTGEAGAGSVISLYSREWYNRTSSPAETHFGRNFILRSYLRINFHCFFVVVEQKLLAGRSEIDVHLEAGVLRDFPAVWTAAKWAVEAFCDGCVEKRALSLFRPDAKQTKGDVRAWQEWAISANCSLAFPSGIYLGHLAGWWDTLWGLEQRLGFLVSHITDRGYYSAVPTICAFGTKIRDSLTPMCKWKRNSDWRRYIWDQRESADKETEQPALGRATSWRGTVNQDSVVHHKVQLSLKWGPTLHSWGMDIHMHKPPVAYKWYNLQLYQQESFSGSSLPAFQ